MLNNKEKKSLEVDIYYDEYPKPELIKVSNVTINKIITTKPNTIIDINSPRNNSDINENNIETKRTNTSLYLTIITFLFCIGLGIMCIMIALKQNKSDKENMIKLEGPIVYVFYLGVLILFCVCFCLSASTCAHCSDICLIFTH